MSDHMDEESQRRRVALFERMRADNAAHRREMRRLQVMYVRAVMDGLTERDELGAAGLDFAAMRERREQDRRERLARRRRADAETASRERLHGALRDANGLDFADQWVR